MRLDRSEQSCKKREILSLVAGISLVLLAVIVLFCFTCIIVSAAIADSQSDRIFDVSDIPPGEYDCVVVLGAGLLDDGSPTPMLCDRVSVGVEVFKATGAPYILMSGDRVDDQYDEPFAMRALALSLGVDPDKIILDGQGYSTFESVERVQEVYGFENVIVITQKYHIFRALFIADQFGIDAVGVPSNLRPYKKPVFRELREIFARAKDFYMFD